MGWPTGGAWGGVSHRTAPRADTRAHTQRGGIPAPRLPTAPLGAVSGMWDTHPAGGHGASPEPWAPLRPASPSLPWGGSGLLPEGDGGRQGSWRPHGTSGTAWGAGRCRNRRMGMLAHGPAAQHLPCPSAGAGTHRSSRSRWKEEEKDPHGGVVPQKTPTQGGLGTGGDASSWPRPCTRVCNPSGTTAPNGHIHTCVCTRVLALHADTGAHALVRVRTLTPLHARPGGCCTPTHALPRPGQMLARTVHTHPVMGARTPSLPGRAALSPRLQFLFTVMEPPARPSLHRRGLAGAGATAMSPATWPRTWDAGAVASPRA